MKTGMEYFSMDVDFFADKKIKILKSRYGSDGITLYLYLLCEIYKAGYFLRVDDDFEFIVSDDLDMSSDKVKQVLNFLLERSLFDNTLFQSDKVLTSAGIQKRFQLMVKSRAKKNPIEIKDFWILAKEETEPFIKVNSFLNYSGNNADLSGKNTSSSANNDIKESKVNKSKVNKSKVKENIDMEMRAGCFANEELENAFHLYITCRKKNGQKLREDQIQLLRQELTSLGADDKERIAIVKKATVSGWKSFYPIKKTGAGKSNGSNRFNNFHQRNYDYEKLEAELLKSQEGK